ncbi:MAG TPA: carboxypeptidase regulatory-like domain-containing protein, partial [Pyrinomonadaceae bacterium]
MTRSISTGIAGKLLLLLTTAVFALTGVVSAQQNGGKISGIVRDPKSAIVSGAEVSLLHAQQVVLRSTQTDASGQFVFDDIPSGTYEVRVFREGFGVQSKAAQVSSGRNADLEFMLEVSQLSSEVTVSAETGQAQDKDRIPQPVNVVTETSIEQRTTAVLAQVAKEEVGVSMQRTSPTIGAVLVRGLTEVGVYVDGVRYTNSTQRGGINTFFNLNEPTSLRSVELLRSPNTAQYGSDSLGGTVQLISRQPEFGHATPSINGGINTFFNSADLSFGSNALLTFGTKRLGVLVNGVGRRVNTLRSGGGRDDHAAVNRFLGLPSDVFGNRLPDTAFTQYGGTLHLS